MGPQGLAAGGCAANDSDNEPMAVDHDDLPGAAHDDQPAIAQPCSTSVEQPGTSTQQEQPVDEAVHASTASCADGIALHPEVFVADVTNAVYDYCADGIDALERTVLQLDVLDASVKEKIQQGLHELYLQLLSHVDDSMSVFERLALSTTLHVPPELCTAQASTSAAAAQVAAPAGDDGSELDQQLEALRQKVQEVRQDNRQLQSQINHLDRQLCVAGDGSSYAPLSAAIGTNKENLMEDMTAISEAARKLRPLLDKAQQLKQEREPHPVVTIADVGAADLTARQQISSMGGTLEDLQQLLA